MKSKDKGTALIMKLKRCFLNCEYQTNPIHRSLRIESQHSTIITSAARGAKPKYDFKIFENNWATLLFDSKNS